MIGGSMGGGMVGGSMGGGLMGDHGGLIGGLAGLIGGGLGRLTPVSTAENARDRCSLWQPNNSRRQHTMLNCLQYAHVQVSQSRRRVQGLPTSTTTSIDIMSATWTRLIASFRRS